MYYSSPTIRYGTIPQSRHQRNRPFFPNTQQLLHPSNNNNKQYAPSLYTDMDALEDELDSQIIVPKPLPVHTVSQQPDPVEEDAPEEPDVVDEAHEEEAGEVKDDTVQRRPSPPSFLKHLGEELQLEEPIKQLQSPNQSFHYSKQHTGLKNLSFNVGAAVMPTAKMEFDEDQPASFGVVKINRRGRNPLPLYEDVPHKIIGRKKCLRLDVPDPEKLMMGTSKSVENLTDQGYLDLKYYHNKLWWRRDCCWMDMETCSLYLIELAGGWTRI